MMPEPTARQDASDALLKQELAQRETELAIIGSVQQALVARYDVQSIYDLVGDKIRDTFSAQVVMISTYDRQTNSVEHRYAIERGQRVYAPGPHPPGGFRSQIVQTRQPILVNSNVAELAARLGQPTLPGTITPKSWLGVPMLVGDKVTGILSLQDVEHEHAFTESNLRLLQNIAASMSIALENARLFDETQRLLKDTEQQAAELLIINSVQEGLARRLDMAAIYEMVGEKLRAVFQQADLSIAIYEPETDTISAPYLIDSGKRLTTAPVKLNGQGFAGYVLRSPQPLLINENMAEVARRYGSYDATGAGIAKSALYVPLLLGGIVRGAIVLQDMQREHAFSESDVRLLETLANSMSVALENARLLEQESLYRKAMEHEFEIGRSIQAGFLPETLPQPKGWEIAASLKSAREVAGDFYDVFRLAHGKVGLVIADVCDKGLGAALFMTLFRSLIRAVASIDCLAHADSAGKLSCTTRLKNAISITNDYIAETHGKTGMFATVFFGILDTRTGALKYINGGHLPPLIVGHQGIRQILSVTGPAIGMIAHAAYGVGDVKIECGDTLFAYTDGLTDTTNAAGEYFSQQAFIPLLAGSQTLSKLLAQIETQVEGYAAGTHQIDDITMLAVRRRDG